MDFGGVGGLGGVSELCVGGFVWESMRSRLSCDEPSFPRWSWLFEVSSKVRALDLPVLVRLSSSLESFAEKRDTVLSLVVTGSVVDDAVVALKRIEAEEVILAAMGGILEGVKPGRKSFCCRKEEGNFDANAGATASVTRLLVSAPCFFASCANRLSCLSWASSCLVRRSFMAW